MICSSRVSLFCTPPASTAETPAFALSEEAKLLVITLFLSTVFT